jgi:hypothetical protein
MKHYPSNRYPILITFIACAWIGDSHALPLYDDGFVWNRFNDYDAGTVNGS